MIGSVLTAAVAAIHVYILILEMFLWTTPRGRKVFGTTEDFARASRVLAANQASITASSRPASSGEWRLARPAIRSSCSFLAALR